MAATFPCSRCKTELTQRVAPPTTLVCPNCRQGHHVDANGVQPSEEFPPAPVPASGLKLGAQADVDGVACLVIGRTVQSQGKNRWSEWALLDRDGKVHFLSEAQGALHLLKLRGVRQRAPSPASIMVNSRLELEAGEVFHVKERGESVVVSAEGELPYLASLGERVAYADLEAVGGALATLDWREGLDAPPDLWDGYPTTLADLGLGGKRGSGTRFVCPGCKNELTLILGDHAITVGCPRCSMVSHRTDEGWQQDRPQHGHALRPILRLGTTATLRGETIVVAGAAGRACVVDGETYTWTEYFCVVKDRVGGPPEQSHRWLVEQDGHWSFIRPISRGDVMSGDGTTLMYQGETFKEFSTVRGSVERILGEQPYWTGPGEMSRMTDYVRPPRLLSEEQTDGEAFWSVGDYIPRKEMRAAFPDVEEFPAPDGIAPNQPNPARATAMWMLLATAAFWVVILLVYLIMAGGARREEVFAQDITIAPPPAGGATAQSTDTAFYSEPLPVRADNRNMRVFVSSNSLQNEWLSVDVALIHEATGKVRGTTVNLEYYSGVTGGEHWTEGKRTTSGYLASVPKGTHVLRLDAECGKKPCPTFTVRLTSDSPRPLYAFLLMFLLSLAPIIAFAYSQYQETQRWMNSTHSAG